MENHLDFQLIQPDSSIRDFVYCFSSLKNFCKEHDAVVIPNGKVDLIFSISKDNRLQTVLLGLESRPKYPSQDVNDFFSVSLHPVAVEYILGFPIADILNSGKLMPDHFWDFHPDDLNDFGGFCSKMTQKIHSLLPEKADPRKLKLFKLIADSNGEISVGELSEKVLWSPREINRYFNKQFGLSVKAYCKILRFRLHWSTSEKANCIRSLILQINRTSSKRSKNCRVFLQKSSIKMTMADFYNF